MPRRVETFELTKDVATVRIPASVPNGLGRANVKPAYKAYKAYRLVYRPETYC